MEDLFALSLKQPWAALVVTSLKTIEVRRWPTERRGRILIHAARVPDPRPSPWDKLPTNLREQAELGGGVVGEVEIVDCVAYRDRTAFAADCPKHLNEADWFAPPMWGFVLSNPRPLPYRRVPGNVRFFRVPAALLS